MAHSSKKKAAVKTAVSGKAASKTTATTRKPSVQKKAVVSKKQASAKKAIKKKVTGKTATPAGAGVPSISITPEERWKMIAIAAYHKAEARGFAPGGELQDWLKAEEEIDNLITGYS